MRSTVVLVLGFVSAVAAALLFLGSSSGPSPGAGADRASGSEEDHASGSGTEGTSDGDHASPPDEGVLGGPISISGRSFPHSVTVDGSVTWVNHDDDEHTVTATDGSFHAVLDPGEEFTFSEPGTYSYLCSYHDDMTGTVTVTTTAPVTR